jgi:ShK domain-like
MTDDTFSSLDPVRVCVVFVTMAARRADIGSIEASQTQHQPGTRSPLASQQARLVILLRRLKEKTMSENSNTNNVAAVISCRTNPMVARTTATATTGRRRPSPFSRASRTSSSSVATLAAVLALAAALAAVITPLRVDAQECSSTNPTLCDRHERCGVWKQEGECQLSRTYMKEVCPASCEPEFITATRATAARASGTAAHMQKKKKKKSTTTANKNKKEAPVKEEEQPLPCEDQHERCHIWARVGECAENKSAMRKYCPKACGFCGSGGPAAAVVGDDADDDDDSYDVEDDDDESVHFDSDDGDEDDEDDDLDGLLLDDLEEEEEEDTLPDCQDTQDLCTYWASVGECQSNRYMHKNGPCRMASGPRRVLSIY